jgi:murein DD-endopeptidase MepM/ murein hydrolase activator NlpD
MTGEAGSRFVTVLVQRDGATKSRTFRIRLLALRAGVGLLGLAAIGLVVVAASYLPVVRAAARVPGLEREVDRLAQENAKVRELSAALDSLERRYVQLRQMIGADILRDPVAIASTLPVAPPIRARLFPAVASTPGPTPPSRWPLDDAGYITRGQVDSGLRDEPHPGIDIAVASGSLVRAAGGATVRQAGEDPEYGLFVLLDHAGDYQTMYGHLSRVVVAAGAPLAPGAVIGLSGNTGRSTAPHLHFEVRQGGRSLDPLTIATEGR